VQGLLEEHQTWTTSGFVAGPDIESGDYIRTISSFSYVRTFSSRQEVDLYLQDAAFTVQVNVNDHAWVLVAPLPLCQLIQEWASAWNGSPAIIRSHPNLTLAYEEIQSSMDFQGKLTFLSPMLKNEDSLNAPQQSANILESSFSFPMLPKKLPRDCSHGCFRPTSMIIQNVPYHEMRMQNTTYTLIYSDWGNSPVKVKSCHGYDSLQLGVALPRGNYLVIPFQEDINTGMPLTKGLVHCLPYYCWPVPAQSLEECEQVVNTSNIYNYHTAPNEYQNNASQVSLASESTL
jgi:hypothetical protein